MLDLGKTQELQIARQVSFGFYLTDPLDPTEAVLLPGGQIPDDTPVGNIVNVFLYKDSKDRLIATVKKPLLEVGQIGMLTVRETEKIGAFLDWGLPKDLFLPFREQTGKVKKGCSYPVAVYIDKSGRLCATMRLYDRLSTNSPYEKDAHVNGHIYEMNPKFGIFVAVDERYSGMIPRQEDTRGFKLGDAVSCRVSAVREDGKLTLSPREKAYIQIGNDADVIEQALLERDGHLALTDHSDPEEIRKVLHMSKAAFKRGVGHLLKEGKITLFEHEIVRKD